jgi:hypothetical protein
MIKQWPRDKGAGGFMLLVNHFITCPCLGSIMARPISCRQGYNSSFFPYMLGIHGTKHKTFGGLAPFLPHEAFPNLVLSA